MSTGLHYLKKNIYSFSGNDCTINFSKYNFECFLGKSYISSHLKLFNDKLVSSVKKYV